MSNITHNHHKFGNITHIKFRVLFDNSKTYFKRCNYII